MINITIADRKQLYADKFLFNRDDTIPINAIDLIAELVEQERLAKENVRLRERITSLELSLQSHLNRALSEPQHKFYDIKGNLS
jgi:hypothetical protein